MKSRSTRSPTEPHLPAAANDAASESIGGAFGVATRIDGEIGLQIARAAQEAFVTSFVWTIGIFAVVAIVAGIITWQLMRGRETEPAMQASDWESVSEPV